MELLIVIVILAVLAAIAIPRFMDSGQRSKDASLKSDLKLVRDAVQAFNSDCAAYPATLADLTAASAPANGLDGLGTPKAISATDWHGPYLMSVPTDPVCGLTFKYNNGGTVNTRSSGNDADGNLYSSY